MFKRLIGPLQLLVAVTGLAAAIFAVSPGSASTPGNPNGYFVVADSRLLFSKQYESRYPDHAEILALLG